MSQRSDRPDGSGGEAPHGGGGDRAREGAAGAGEGSPAGGGSSEDGIDRSTPPLKSLYQQLILDHYRKPRNRGELDDHTVEIHMRNPTCGDEIKLQLRIEDDRIADIGHLGEGCSISQASVSMMSALLKGRPLDDAHRVARRFTSMMHGDEEAAKDTELGNLRSLAGVARFPVRVKCALLGFDALQEGMKRTRSE